LLAGVKLKVDAHAFIFSVKIIVNAYDKKIMSVGCRASGQ